MLKFVPTEIKHLLFITFFLTTTALFFQSILLPHFTLLAYAPWIALILLLTSLPQCLFLSFLAGAMLDLLSDDPMGTHALNYTVITMFLYRFRSYFLYDQPFHLGVFTLIISFCSTLLQLFLLFLFDRRVPFTGQWALADLFLMPVADAIYSLVWVAFPLSLYKKVVVYWKKLYTSHAAKTVIDRAKNFKLRRP